MDTYVLDIHLLLDSEQNFKSWCDADSSYLCCISTGAYYEAGQEDKEKYIGNCIDSRW